MPQLSYPIAPPIGFAGMLADGTLLKDCESAFNQEASAELPFGIMVKRGTVDQAVKLMTANTETPWGITVHSLTYELGTFAGTVPAGTGGIVPKDPVSVLTRGRIFVAVEEAVTPASVVYVRVSGTGQAGAFRASAAGSSGVETLLLKGARYCASQATIGGLVKLEFDLMANH